MFVLCAFIDTKSNNRTHGNSKAHHPSSPRMCTYVSMHILCVSQCVLLNTQSSAHTHTQTPIIYERYGKMKCYQTLVGAIFNTHNPFDSAVHMYTYAQTYTLLHIYIGGWVYYSHRIPLLRSISYENENKKKEKKQPRHLRCTISFMYAHILFYFFFFCSCCYRTMLTRSTHSTQSNKT